MSRGNAEQPSAETPKGPGSPNRVETAVQGRPESGPQGRPEAGGQGRPEAGVRIVKAVPQGSPQPAIRRTAPRAIPKAPSLRVGAFRLVFHKVGRPGRKSSGPEPSEWESSGPGRRSSRAAPTTQRPTT